MPVQRCLALVIVGLVLLFSASTGPAGAQKTDTPTLTATLTSTRAPTATATSTATPTPTATLPPLLDVSAAQDAYCGGLYRGDTHSGQSNVGQYRCQPGWDESGPELIYRIQIGTMQPLTVTLLNVSMDLDLFLLRQADPESCVAAGDSFLVYPAAPHEYLLVVDGYQGAAGPFTLRIDCPLEVQATATPTFTPSPRPTPTMTHTPSTTPTPRNIYLPQILRSDP